MEFILATSNAHKASEFNELINPKILTVLPAAKKLNVIEDGLSYFENSFLKAKAYYDEFHLPVLADDSGLNVEVMPDELGIHSARFGGDQLKDFERANLLLQKMQGQTNRNAYFVCVLCAYIGPNEVFYFEGRMNGLIAHAYKGTTGFGYDPVFIPLEKEKEGLTIAELHEWKQKNSHRSLACSLLEKFLEARK
jgi:XTP/dITP diphosphohydrolase